MVRLVFTRLELHFKNGHHVIFREASLCLGKPLFTIGSTSEEIKTALKGYFFTFLKETVSTWRKH